MVKVDQNRPFLPNLTSLKANFDLFQAKFDLFYGKFDLFHAKFDQLTANFDLFHAKLALNGPLFNLKLYLLLKTRQLY